MEEHYKQGWNNVRVSGFMVDGYMDVASQLSYWNYLACAVHFYIQESLVSFQRSSLTIGGRSTSIIFITNKTERPYSGTVHMYFFI